MDLTLTSMLAMVLAVPCSRGVPSIQPASSGDAPYSVVVHFLSVCSGALVDRRWVLTAAHCLYREHQNITPSAIKVVAGSLTTSDSEKGGMTQILHGASVSFFSSFNDNWAEHDIAAIELDGEFIMTDSVQTIPLSSQPWGRHSRRLCQVSGYGRLQKGVTNPLDFRLKTHTLNITRPCPCEAELVREKGYDRVRNWLCSELGPHSGPCKGDSGAPLVCSGRLWGLTSATFYIHDPPTCNMSLEPQQSRCGTVHELNIFMDLHPHSAWLSKLMGSTVLANRPSPPLSSVYFLSWGFLFLHR